ncbi:hypothetical protein M3Y98_00084800 [Aphelenchoides besseyi]|nr:hypothetical protein M3Y98_00084800 [Aphelenchoides besseyi]
MIPPFTKPFLCTNSDTCVPYFLNGNFQLALKPGTNYTVKEKFDLMDTNYTNCLNDSIALILTDIPCSQYSKYPDLEQLFGDKNLNRTIKWLTELRLLTVVFYLSQSGAEPCAQFDNYEFNNETDYLWLYRPTYLEATTVETYQ